ncbi:unnamed protein product [Rodentolepis nana]|uniref:Ig-like domain-containing protein n=1 Tax=Rodentolepis nana TaxID=102285 RepID=A0A0R3TQW5_RODNA|nr:unnamed protein product [Rodentolepis nana]
MFGQISLDSQLIFVLCGLFNLSLSQDVYQIPPSFTALPPREIIHTPGQPFKVPCAASGHPQPRLEWYLNGERLAVSRSGITSTSKWSSEGRNAIVDRKHDGLWDLSELFVPGRFSAGWLYCVAINPIGRAISSPVWSKLAQIDESKPCETRTITLRDQPFLRLNCTVPESSPSATVRWMYRQPNGFMEFIHENRTFAMDDDGEL